jgi:hypothetical protein
VFEAAPLGERGARHLDDGAGKIESVFRAWRRTRRKFLSADEPFSLCLHSYLWCLRESRLLEETDTNDEQLTA